MARAESGGQRPEGRGQGRQLSLFADLIVTVGDGRGTRRHRRCGPQPIGAAFLDPRSIFSFINPTDEELAAIAASSRATLDC
jgi:hypothetical protein